MALDFYRLSNKEYLFGIDSQKFEQLTIIFETFRQWTGQSIDEYSDLKLTLENQQTLITIIDKYVEATDLNKDKGKISTILEFKGLLNYFFATKIELLLIGD